MTLIYALILVAKLRKASHMLKKRSKASGIHGPNRKLNAYIEIMKSKREEKFEEAALDKEKKHQDNDFYK